MAHAELAVRVGHVPLHRGRGDGEPLGDLLVPEPGGDQAEDDELARGQEEGDPIEQQRQSECGVPYVVQAVGQPEAIEALMAKPEVAAFELDLSCLEEESHQVEGGWFPYQISVGEFQFLLDDDGVIYTCTDNFPERLVEQVRAEVVALANRIYTKILDDRNSSFYNNEYS